MIESELAAMVAGMVSFSLRSELAHGPAIVGCASAGGEP